MNFMIKVIFGALVATALCCSLKAAALNQKDAKSAVYVPAQGPENPANSAFFKEPQHQVVEVCTVEEFFTAIRHGNEKFVNYYLNAIVSGINHIVENDTQKLTALHVASMCGSVAIVDRLLLHNGMNVMTKDASGVSAYAKTNNQKIRKKISDHKTFDIGELDETSRTLYKKDIAHLSSSCIVQ